MNVGDVVRFSRHVPNTRLIGRLAVIVAYNENLHLPFKIRFEMIGDTCHANVQDSEREWIEEV